jgi:succinate dehydrogenase / fumarate reductase membrane anchor subunit
MSTDRNVGAKSVKSWKQSARHGAGEWLAERGTSVVMVPLAIWALISATGIVGTGYEGALAWARVPLNASLLGLLIVVACWHMYMGLKVIIDDYLAGPMRSFLTFLVLLLSAAVAIATVGALFVLHQGA